MEVLFYLRFSLAGFVAVVVHTKFDSEKLDFSVRKVYRDVARFD